MNYYQVVRKVLRLAGAVTPLPSLAGCSTAPSIALFGATFPDWLLCAGSGCFIMLAIHILLRDSKFREWLQPAVLVYPCMTALATMFLWLLIFPA